MINSEINAKSTCFFRVYSEKLRIFAPDMRKMLLIIPLLSASMMTQAQEQKTAEQVLAEMDSPTFVPTVKVGKVLHEGDSIQYMEMNNVYVYPQLTFKNKKQAQSYMLFRTYKPKMKKLTYSQGKLLIKLIDRECHSSSYDMIKAFMGPLRAGFWQVFAWGFGASLKKEYDPTGTDRLTERVVLMVEAGQI